MNVTIYPGCPAEASLEVISTAKLPDGRVLATCKAPAWKTYFPIVVGTLKDGILTQIIDCRDHAEAQQSVRQAQYRCAIRRCEKAVVRAIAKAALAAGLNVTVRGVECYKATKLSTVMENALQQDEDFIVFCRGDKKVGSIHLVYGNTGWDTICDYSSAEEIAEIVKAGEAVQDKFEAANRNRTWA